MQRLLVRLIFKKQLMALVIRILNIREEGRYVLHSTSDLAPSMNLLREGTCVLEAWIPYEKELSVLISGGRRRICDISSCGNN